MDLVIGKLYPRRSLIELAGSKQNQSGIIWGKKLDKAVICTAGGRHAKKAGYEDRRNSDGTWAYFGQGVSGNQDPDSFANRLLIEGQRVVLLFTTREPTASEAKAARSHAKKYRFEGRYRVGGWEYFVPHSGRRKGMKLIKFKLLPLTV